MVIPIIIPIPTPMAYGHGELRARPGAGSLIATAILLLIYLTLPLTARNVWVDLPGLFGVVTTPTLLSMSSMVFAVIFGGVAVTASFFSLSGVKDAGKWWFIPASVAVLVLLWIPVLWLSFDGLFAARCAELIGESSLYRAGCS